MLVLSLSFFTVTSKLTRSVLGNQHCNPCRSVAHFDSCTSQLRSRCTSKHRLRCITLRVLPSCQPVIVCLLSLLTIQTPFSWNFPGRMPSLHADWSHRPCVRHRRCSDSDKKDCGSRSPFASPLSSATIFLHNVFLPHFLVFSFLFFSFFLFSLVFPV